MITAHATFIVLTERAAGVGVRERTTRWSAAAVTFRRLVGWIPTGLATTGRVRPRPQRMIV